MPRRIDQFLRRNLLEGSSSSVSSSSSTSSDDDLNPSLLVIGLILIGVFLASAIIHIVLRYITRLCKSAHIGQEEEVDDEDVIEPPPLSLNQISSNRRVAAAAVVPHPLPPLQDELNQKLIESLPLFSFESVTGLKSSSSAAASSADCAVCLSKFERHDQLRLLPICCHAFHSDCIDMWLSSNTTCPLCRSTVNVANSEDYLKLFGGLHSRSSSTGGNNNNNDSFRIEIGSVSRRRISPVEEIDDRRPRSYSMGSFEYVLDDDDESTAEVVVVVEREPIHRRGVSECTTFGAKEDEVSAPSTETTMPNPSNSNQYPAPPGSEIAGEVGEGRGWLRDYVDKLAYSSSSSLSRSLRFSGRFFTGSNRMSEGISSRSGRRSVDIAAGGGDSRSGSWDLEGNRYGEEISNFFRWLSGV